MANETPTANRLFGPRKLGQEAYERQKRDKVNKRRGGTVYGHRKGGGEPAESPPAVAPNQPGPEPSTAPSPEAPGQPHATTAPGPSDAENPFIGRADADENGYVTLAELDEILADEPTLLDVAIKAEFREGKPRKGACKIFRDLEEKREGGPRESITKLLANHL